MEKMSALKLHRLRYRERRAAETTEEREQGYRVTESGDNTSCSFLALQADPVFLHSIKFFVDSEKLGWLMKLYFCLQEL